MNLQQLKTFVAIAESKKVTAAAHQLNLKQPTVSFHIKKLEESIQLPLFTKRYNYLLLTEQGQTLYDYAKRIIGLVDEAERVLEEYQTNQRGHILIGASNIPANYLLPQILHSFNQRYPHIKISLTVQTAPSILEKLKGHEIDVGIVSGNYPNQESFLTQKLADDSLGIIVSSGHPFTFKEYLSIHDIEHLPLILQKDGSTRSLIEQWFTQNNIQPSVIMELGSVEAIKKLIISGAGASILSKRAIKDEIEKEKVVFINSETPFPNRSIYLLRHKDRHLSPKLAPLIELLTHSL